MPNQTEPLAEPIRFKTNVIAPVADAPGGSRFIVAGEDSPYRSLDEVPTNLRPLIVSDSPEEPEEPNEARGSFEMGVPYELTDDGRLGRQLRRKVERQVAELQAANDYEEQLEEEAANAELPPEVAESLQEAHESHIGLQTAQLAAAARAADDITDAVIAAQEPPQLYVKRGSRHYIQIHRTKLKAAEPVFTKDDTGAYECIGETDSKGSPPEPPITIT
jgi:hypothetical protein